MLTFRLPPPPVNVLGISAPFSITISALPVTSIFSSPVALSPSRSTAASCACVPLVSPRKSMFPTTFIFSMITSCPPVINRSFPLLLFKVCGLLPSERSVISAGKYTLLSILLILLSTFVSFSSRISSFSHNLYSLFFLCSSDPSR